MMKKVLLYYSFSFSFGGGEHLPLSLIAALQDICQLTVALDVSGNLERAAKLIGIEIDLSKVKVVQVTPQGYNPKQHDAFASYYRSRHLQKLAKEANICISTANIMDFGKPAHHFINMLAFGDDAFTAFVQNPSKPIQPGIATKTKRFIVESMLRPIMGMRSKKRIICDRREHIYPNSHFVEGLMTQFYGPFNSSVFYPPTLFEPSSAPAHAPLKVVYIGRILPEKRIVDLIDIVEKARSATGLDIVFHLAGRLDQTPAYGEKLSHMAAERDWLKFVGPLYGKEKEEFLLSGSYALHAERCEAFGIAIVEYLKSGIIAIVPDEGGACEVVNNPALSYKTNEQATDILVRLLLDKKFREIQQLHCIERAKLFSRETYLKRQHDLLLHILS
ncbi:MAG: glycosyltransferase [Victivallales bacterium]|nr:glycosyltransferase [Victivallales bacterium]